MFKATIHILTEDVLAVLCQIGRLPISDWRTKDAPKINNGTIEQEITRFKNNRN